MAKKPKKKEALTIARYINEILVKQLKIPFSNIVNDTTFNKYTGSLRPDLLISDVAYNLEEQNDDQYIKNLVAYAEAKDNCKVGDKEWIDAFNQGVKKAKPNKLNIPYFIVTNSKVSYFYNSKNKNELKLNGNPIREFQSIDVLRLILKRLQNNPDIVDISTSVDTQSSISESVFNKKLWELANIYRALDFLNSSEKIDFTIGFVSLKVFEEKMEKENNKDSSKDYWTDLKDYIRRGKKDSFVSALAGYIKRLEHEADFKEFKDLMDIVHTKVTKLDSNGNHLFSSDDTIEIFEVIDSMGKLHNSGFDLFGAVYEMFASNKEKSDFGEFFTRRHYTHIFAKLLLKDEKSFKTNTSFKILDPACGTGGFLTETFKLLQTKYITSNSYNIQSETFLKKDCFFGYDVKEENVSRTKINMFLVGDGHTHIEKKDTLRDKLNFNSYRYILTNPPYGNGIEKADTSSISTKRYEISFLSKIIQLLEEGGKSCVIIPDGFFENPSYEKFRIEVIEKCLINAIISLPKFAFAPYTKEKTYALFFEKKNKGNTKIQNEPIWMYIIDNDGYANSDKRFQTKMKDNNGRWLHDEISAWIDKEGLEEIGLLEKRWMKFDDINTGGTEWVDEKGNHKSFKKGGFIELKDINKNNYHNMLPEFHLRPYEPTFITIKEINNLLEKVDEDIFNVKQLKQIDNKQLVIDTEELELVPLRKILNYVSRNDSLSEEGIYNSYPVKNNDKKIQVLSGSVDNIFYGEISKNTPNIHYIEEAPILHIVTRGKAGKLTFVEKGTYASNTNAFILYLNNNILLELDINTEIEKENYLKFLEIYLQPIFYDVSSNSDVSIFPLTKIFKELEIPCFKYNSNIESIIKKYDKIRELNKKWNN